MSAQVLDGYQLAKSERDRMKAEVSRLKKEKGIVPGLAIVAVKSPVNRISVAYLKERVCRQLGINCRIYRLPEKATEEEISSLIAGLNADPKVHGINLHPLPPHMNQGKIAKAILPEKDVEGLNAINLGNFLIGQKNVIPFTPRGIIALIESTGINIKGKHAVVVGRSHHVGQPVAFLLLERHATVTVCHSGTIDLAAKTRKADILVVAAGIPRLIKGDMIKPGALVVDVGVNRVGDRLMGDVDFDAASNVAGWITPVPGGVGPMTVTMLIANVVEAAAK